MLYGALVVFLGGIYLLSDSIDYLKKPLTGQDNVPQHLTALSNSISERKWDTAEKEMKAVEQAWNKVQKRVQIAGEAEDITAIDELLVRIKTAIKIRSYEQANMDTASLRFHWSHVGK